MPLGDDFTAEFDRDIASLNILHVYPEDAGEYTCVAYNELGTVASSAYLKVDGKNITFCYFVLIILFIRQS